MFLSATSTPEPMVMGLGADTARGRAVASALVTRAVSRSRRTRRRRPAGR